MKRIKDIITAAKTLGLDPVALLKGSVKIFDDMVDGEDASKLDESDKVRARIVRQVLDAVVIIAEDMEKPAKAEGEAAK